MWRTKGQRESSALERLAWAERIWGWRPHRSQQEFFGSGASVRVAACGRRWGKTESLSIDAATLALCERGSRQLIVAPTEFQARLLGEAVRDRLEHAFLHGDPEGLGRALIVRARPHLRLTITGPGGASESQILCRTAGRDGRNLRGLWAHRIIVDEAAYVPDRVLNEVLPPMLADKGGEFLLASSPNGRRAAFYTLFARGESPQRAASEEDVSYGSFQCPTGDNPHLDNAWLRSQREEMGELLYAQEFEAKFIDDYGMVFREEDIDKAVTTLEGVEIENNEAHSEAKDDRVYIIGADWGRKYDYTVIAVLDATEPPFRLVHLSRWRGTGWQTQAAQAAGIVARFRPRRILVDGNSMGDPVAGMLDREIQKQMPALRRPTVEQFTFGSESKQALIDRLNVGLSGHALQIPKHPALVNELKNFEYAPGGPGRLKMAARGTGHDDCVIALALAFYAAPDPAARPGDLGVLLASQLGLEQRE